MTVKIQQFQLSKNKQSKATRIAKVLYILWVRSLIKSWKHWWFKLNSMQCVLRRLQWCETTNSIGNWS